MDRLYELSLELLLGELPCWLDDRCTLTNQTDNIRILDHSTAIQNVHVFDAGLKTHWSGSINGSDWRLHWPFRAMANVKGFATAQGERDTSAPSLTVSHPEMFRLLWIMWIMASHWNMCIRTASPKTLEIHVSFNELKWCKAAEFDGLPAELSVGAPVESQIW